MSHQPSKSNEEIVGGVEEFVGKDSLYVHKGKVSKYFLSALQAKDAEREKAVEEERNRLLDIFEYRSGTSPFQTGSDTQWDRGVMFHWQGLKNLIAELRTPPPTTTNQSPTGDVK